ncbi:MAG: SAM-dependent methyltransferase [Acidimicrobiales bacterium]
MIDHALYGPGGFYVGGGGAGRDRDYLTSPALGGLFGSVVARAIDERWERCGRPDPWIVVEAGAGSGALAKTVLAADPACAPALRYVAVEISPVLRAAAARALPIDDPAQVLGPVIGDETPHHQGGLGPLVTAVAEMPAGPFVGVVLANELLDNLPFDVYERGETAWLEIRVGLDADQLTDVRVPAPADVDAHLCALAADAKVGSRVPWQHAAREWLRGAIGRAERGGVIVIDYGRSTAEMAAAGDWLRTYRAGGPGAPPLESLGAQDITADIGVDQLALIDHPLRVSTQADWLHAHGLGELAAQAAAAWRERAQIGDLRALQARSRLGEAAALVDPAGLGGFVVLETT